MEMDEALVLHIGLLLKSKAANEIVTVRFHTISRGIIGSTKQQLELVFILRSEESSVGKSIYSHSIVLGGFELIS